ncbi:hypothetical protein [Candidatus Amarolinea dominans]|uniref:hypothetical protein n=1 Tax=Candidatus Amarolinea dominans TaxID=3140696 RepID=UPI0031CCA021
MKATIRPISQFEPDTARPIIPVCEPTLTGNELEVRDAGDREQLVSSAGSFIRSSSANLPG